MDAIAPTTEKPKVPKTWEDRNEDAIAEARTSATSRHWYVLRIDSSQTGKAIDIIPQLGGVVAFAPVEQRTRRSGRGLRSSITKAQPIMSGYVIVGFNRHPNWYVLFQMPWIYNVISRDGRPARIPPEAMRSCFNIHQSSSATSLPGARSLKKGDTIRVLEGGWRGHEAKLIDISGADCEFVVQLFGRDVKWRQPIAQVEAA